MYEGINNKLAISVVSLICTQALTLSDYIHMHVCVYADVCNMCVCVCVYM